MYVCTDAVKGDNQWHWGCGQKAELLVYSDLDAHLINPRWPQSGALHYDISRGQCVFSGG